MKKIFTLTVLTLLCSYINAQEVKWAKSINAPADSKGLVTDEQANIYSYGSVLPNHSYYDHRMNTDDIGSYLYKYSPAGEMLMKKAWNTSFHIQKMVHDGASGFYFAGSFFQSFSIDGHFFNSRGGSDGVVGKMTESGTILWITTFGDMKNDVCNGIALSHDKNSLVITGGVSDNFFMNGSLVQPGTQYSTLIAELDLSGKLTRHRLLNFMESRNEINIGNEITRAGNGGYLLLAQQEGRFWTDDSANVPPYGHYVYSLDAALNIKWSQFIINGGCYYGYSCAGLSGSEEGDAFIPSFCSFKYGGSGQLRRLDGASGAATWTLSNTDGAYADTHCSAGNVYLVGTEGANGCPCESHDIGYQVIKSYNIDNELRWMMKLHDVKLTDITRHENGTVYAAGIMYHETAVIGGHEMRVNVRDYYPNRGSFIIALTDLQAETKREPKSSYTGIFPNPSDGMIDVRISHDTNIGHAEVRVLSYTGEEVKKFSYNIYGAEFETKLDLSAMNAGIYLIEINAAGSRKVSQLILK